MTEPFRQPGVNTISLATTYGAALDYLSHWVTAGCAGYWRPTQPPPLHRADRRCRRTDQAVGSFPDITRRRAQAHAARGLSWALSWRNKRRALRRAAGGISATVANFGDGADGCGYVQHHATANGLNADLNRQSTLRQKLCPGRRRTTPPRAPGLQPHLVTADLFQSKLKLQSPPGAGVPIARCLKATGTRFPSYYHREDQWL